MILLGLLEGHIGGDWALAGSSWTESLSISGGSAPL